MVSLLDKALQLSTLELLAEVYPREMNIAFLRADYTNARALRFNLMALKAHGLITLRQGDGVDFPELVQLACITSRGLTVLEGEWAPDTDVLPAERIFEDSRPADLRGITPPPLPRTRRRRMEDTPVAALKELGIEALAGLVQLIEWVQGATDWTSRRLGKSATGSHRRSFRPMPVSAGSSSGFQN